LADREQPERHGSRGYHPLVPVPPARDLHRRGLLRDDVYISLRDAIVRGTLAPGERLRDAELATWLGVSRTPIREALLRLYLHVAQDPERTTLWRLLISPAIP
jgi:Bacterial regulatory proteins, gntR family